MTGFDEPTVFLPDILDLHARTHPANPALRCGGMTITWGEFGAQVQRGAAALQAMGAGPGSVVGLMANLSIEAVVATFSIIRTGAAVASLSGMVAADALLAMVLDSGAAILVADQRNQPALDALRSDAPCRMVGLGAASAGWEPLCMPGIAIPECWPALQARDDLCIIYSSGTTSTPKGIVLSHQCRLQNAFSLALEMRYDGRAVVLVTTALYSNTAWSLLTTAILVGGTVVLMPKFSAAEFCSAVARFGISHTTMVPAQFRMIRDDPAQLTAAFSSLRTICSVGSVLPVPLKLWAMERFPGALFEVYGLTEGLVTLLRPEDLPEKLASVGRAMIGHDLRILDDASCPLPPGEAGEIVGYSPVLMTRYHRNPDATVAAMWRDPVSGRSFLRSGDVGYFDPDGFFHLGDRKKDMIVSGGYNVFPSDLERVLQAHPDVSEACVVGVPHPKWQETPLAAVVLTGAAAATARMDTDAMLTWANARLGKHQRISGIVLVATLPRNAGGKVLKRELVRSLAGAGT